MRSSTKITNSALPLPWWSCSHDRINGFLCGDVLEMYIAPEPVKIGQEKPSPEKSKTPETPEECLKRSIARSRKVVRQLCNTNNLLVLHTLTFAIDHPTYFKGEKPFDLVPVETQKDREKVLEMWRQFARRFRAYEESKGRLFRYIAVIEKHTGKRANGDTTVKNDTYHIHFLSDRVHGKRLLQVKWRHGFCNYADWHTGTKSNDLSERYDGHPPDNPGAYACKYLGKDMDSEYLGRKRYWSSKNLKKPERVSKDEIFALTYGRLPIWESVQEREVDGKTFRLERYTYKVDRNDIGKAALYFDNVKDVLAKKRLKKAQHKAFMAYLEADKRYKKELADYERQENRRKQNENADVERLVGSVRMSYGGAREGRQRA